MGTKKADRKVYYIKKLSPKFIASLCQREVWREYKYRCPMGIKKESQTTLFFVPRTRLELARANAHYPLKVACLPISPPGPLHSWRMMLRRKGVQI